MRASNDARQYAACDSRSGNSRAASSAATSAVPKSSSAYPSKTRRESASQSAAECLRDVDTMERRIAPSVRDGSVPRGHHSATAE